MISRLLAGVALALSIGLAGCDLEEVRRAPEVGAAAPQYSAISLAGDSVSIGALEGEVVLLNVWATWCIPCREETPALQRLYERYGNAGLRIVGVSVDARGERQAVADFVDSFGVTYDVWLDPAERIISTYRVIGVPNTYLIDREGIVRWKHMGPVLDDDEQLLSHLREALEG